ncbi:1-(5-phosphoribosyl)-5-[(5-phosphoribosylamino)methylideneamino]imidazole-4-carboxamide isomerase [Hyphobacterium sp. SN044]|uniref:1-(5-phosphoribosyl)-5-[(5- phosphoribosylamino)methylideneamino]imidazole-4- carboxamide isomerase n=1 Tax=Hyphobacterium sp. SN044 TaxID=2912575 RepID=UPI001F0279DB|nr:1-(5-phosphoribosyl)-5-[(5-phosphoribosylamino)methylideneamino]imidazole-4-carboxamide isomerase [Hyphobacterium sp. SN044]MCF8878885.1 1-(5-phosphoribosyl)-5-[(5-phosphoribosylamino)methylideneamino]imidazole-4-carboxamide isomerase [Hyphobacterium sp. SN044]
MQLYPAIDLLDGQIVRLTHGDFDAVTAYGDDPVKVAKAWRDEGADWLHVVDLSGARDGARRQTDTIAQLCGLGLKVQTGGGVRSADDVARLLDAGVSRVIVGSMAVIAPDRFSDWLDRIGGERLIAALDVRMNGDVAVPVVKGWTQASTTTLDALMAKYLDTPLKHVLTTDVGRDGALKGPSTALYARLAKDWPDIAWQASGGVSALADLTALRSSGAEGAIVGRALYENRFTVREAIACLRGA